MATMTAQMPLPVGPAQAVPIGLAAALECDGDGGRVFINGQLSFAWGAGDEAGRRLAAVQLVRIRAASQVQVAAAFGVNTSTLYRWGQTVAESGAAGLAPGRMGPKRPSKLTDAVVAEILARRGAGEQVAGIAAAVGVSQRSVAVVLARARHRERRCAAEGAGSGEGCATADRVHAPGGAGADATGSDADVADAQDGLWDVPVGDASGPGGGSQDVKDAAGGDAGCVPAAGRGAETGTAAADLHAGVTVADRRDTAGADSAGGRALPVLPPRADRDAERALARTGLLAHALPVFVPAARVPLAGLLLAVPALVSTGLLDQARSVYGGVPNGFYGLDTVFIDAVFRALIGEPRAEGATRVNPTDLGRVLGLDRAPEVKTVRRKMAQLACRGLAAVLQQAMAARHVAQDEQASSVLYVDGHVRTYHGTRKVQKTHVSRLRFPAPATVETWVCDATGDPVWVVMAEPGASLAGEIRRLLPEIRTIIGDQRRVLVCFDRGGWSPALFAEMIAAGFDVLTWRKMPAPDVNVASFSEHQLVDDHGATRSWMLAEGTVELALDDKRPELGTVSLRQVTKLDPDTGRQVHILTSRQGLPPAAVAYRMGSRWRQENWFRFGRLHFDLDSHDCYAVGDDDGDRMVPNPAKRAAYQHLQAARSRLQAARQARDRQFLALRSPQPGQPSTITNAMHDAITAPVRDARAQAANAAAEYRNTPARLPLSQVRPGQQILETETKLLTHVIRMAAFNTQTALARAIRTGTAFSRAADEAHALIGAALNRSGDIDPRPAVIHVQLDPLNTPRATAAIAELCQALNTTKTVFPGTDQELRYSVKPHP